MVIGDVILYSLVNMFASVGGTNFLYLCGSAVGWGTALHVGRSRFPLPMVSLEFLINIILPVTLWSWGWLSL